MNTIIYVAVWTHKEGASVGTFTKAARAEKWRQEIASDGWENEMGAVAKPLDPENAADLYFDENRAFNNEYFDVTPTALNAEE